MKNTAQNHNIPKIYASKGITKYIMDLVRVRYVKSGLTIECVADGMIVIDKKVQCFGVFTPNGIFVKQSLQTRGKGQLIPDNIVLENIPYFDYDAIYLGNVDDAFGHYLLEHWTRAYAFLNEKYKTMKYVIVNDKLCYNRLKTKKRRSDKAYIEISVPERILPLFEKYKGKNENLFYSSQMFK